MSTGPKLPTYPGEWVKMGQVCVDSGQLAVIDPCYVIGKGEETITDWTKDYWPYCDDLGIRFSAGYGDGGYDVWAFIADTGEWGKRVAQVVVCMIGPEDEEDEDD